MLIKNKKLILMFTFIWIFGFNFLFDYFFRSDHIDILRNTSVALGITIGSGFVMKSTKKGEE